MKRKVKAVRGNFTVYEFDTRAEMSEFIHDRREVFRFVSYSTAKTKDGKYRICY